MMILELIVAVAIFAIISVPILTLGLGALMSTNDSENHLAATLLAQEGLEAARSIAAANWDNLTVGSHGISDTNGYWEWSGSSDVRNGYTRQITVTTINSDVRDVASTLTWGTGKTLVLTSRLTHWKKLLLTQTVLADFNAGTTVDTAVVSMGDGAVQLVATKTSGTFTSSALDTASGTTVFDRLSWTASQLGPTGTVRFQLRTASTSGGLSSAIWVGPDGTNGTYYTASGTSIVTSPSATGTRWIQYQASFASNGTDQPAVEAVTIEYNS